MSSVNPISASYDGDPGDWEIDWTTLLFAPAEVTDPGERALYIAIAVDACWHLTGERIGAYTETSRPRLGGAQRCHQWISSRWYDAIDLDPSEARPVLGVGDVVIADADHVDGKRTLDPATEYGIVNHRYLVRTPTGARWPQISDIASAIAPLEVTRRFGLLPGPDLVQNGIGGLISQLWKAASGLPCTLNPAVVQSVQREGISFALISQGLAWKDGYTGDPTVDGACLRAWPLGAKIRVAPGWFDPALGATADFTVFDRATPSGP